MLERIAAGFDRVAHQLRIPEMFRRTAKMATKATEYKQGEAYSA